MYSILSIWGLALAYRKIDDDDGRTYELEQVPFLNTLPTLNLLVAFARSSGSRRTHNARWCWCVYDRAW